MYIAGWSAETLRYTKLIEAVLRAKLAEIGVDNVINKLNGRSPQTALAAATEYLEDWNSVRNLSLDMTRIILGHILEINALYAKKVNLDPIKYTTDFWVLGTDAIVEMTNIGLDTLLVDAPGLIIAPLRTLWNHTVVRAGGVINMAVAEQYAKSWRCFVRHVELHGEMLMSSGYYTDVDTDGMAVRLHRLKLKERCDRTIEGLRKLPQPMQMQECQRRMARLMHDMTEYLVMTGHTAPMSYDALVEVPSDIVVGQALYRLRDPGFGSGVQDGHDPRLRIFDSDDYRKSYYEAWKRAVQEIYAMAKGEQ